MKRLRITCEQLRYIAVLLVVLAITVFALGVLTGKAHAGISMEAIKQIESGGNPKAYNKYSKATGLYQITPICLKHFNEVNKTSWKMDDMYDPKKNERVAVWYFTWLERQGLEDEEQIIAYNWGIGNLMKYRLGLKTLPKETRNYLNKYERLTK
jgi:soluble lytic murein transglycosylase-like protein